MAALERLSGTREEDLAVIRHVVRHPRFLASTLLLIGASALLVASVFFPYWHMRLNAPQYPQGLDLTIYIDHLQGDIREIDGLNHYIGMAPLQAAAKVERGLAPFALTTIVIMVMATAFIHRKWFAPLVLPAMLLPVVFLADMYYWMRFFGLTLNPDAALSKAVPPFIPSLLGHGVIGQFSTDASLGVGFWLATASSVLTFVGLHYRRQARLAAERLQAAGATAAA